MDKFIVSARKYRPQNFSTVVGQQHITTTLKNAIKNNQLAHAFLFCGPRGVGKTTCARILAKTINCEKRSKDGEACNKCNSCTSFDNGTSLNIHELDAASNNSVDDIRTLVEQVRFAPQAGKYKVYIVDEVHMLSASAFNAFLKTLEEPPPFAIFILATTEKHKILPTILSRCQIFDFKRITIADTVDHLQEICKKEEIKAEKAALHIIAQKSEGCLRDALSILDKIVSFTNGNLNYANTLEHLNILDEDYYFKLLGFMQQQQLSNALLLFDEINQKGFEGDTLLEGFAEFIRNILVSKDMKAAVLLEVAEDFKEKYLKVAQDISSGWLVAALNIINDSVINYKQARNKRLQVEMTLIKLSYLNQAVELIANENSVGKKKITETSGSLSFRALPIVALKKEKPSREKKSTTAEQEPKLIIEEVLVSSNSQKVAGQKQKPENIQVNTGVAAMGSLNKIRQALAEKNHANGKSARKLDDDEILKAWNEYVKKLEKENKHSTITNFKNAELKVSGENCIEITVESVFHKKFIEAERSELIHFLQDYFNNRLLTYQFLIVKKGTTEGPVEKPLSTKEQYLKLIEEFPCIRLLKDKLKLELDY
jgi:DNA polymerase III subunit gamma/tau